MLNVTFVGGPWDGEVFRLEEDRAPIELCKGKLPNKYWVGSYVRGPSLGDRGKMFWQDAPHTRAHL